MSRQQTNQSSQTQIGGELLYRTVGALPPIVEETEEDLEEDLRDDTPLQISAKESFEKINGIINDQDGDKKGRIEALKDGLVDDKGLSMFVESTLQILDSDKFSDEQKTTITKELSNQFGFIADEGYEKKTTNDKQKLAAKAIIDATGTCSIGDNGEIDQELAENINIALHKGLEKSAPEITKQAEIVKDRINNQNNLSPEEMMVIKENNQKMWNDIWEVTRPASKITVAAVLFCAVPIVPINLILAAGFLYGTWDMGVKSDGPTPPYYPKIEEKYKQMVELAHKQREEDLKQTNAENAKENPTAIGKAATKIVDDETKVLEEGKQKLKTDKEALQHAGPQVLIDTTAQEVAKKVVNDARNTETRQDNSSMATRQQGGIGSR